MNYVENARRIGKLLEDRIPLLREDIAGKDFRPDGHGELIVSGVRFRYPGGSPFSTATKVEEEGPIDFRVLYGGEKLCNDAVEVLNHYGIETRVRLPGAEIVVCDGVETKINRSTWAINFTLPQDWTL